MHGYKGKKAVIMLPAGFIIAAARGNLLTVFLSLLAPLYFFGCSLPRPIPESGAKSSPAVQPVVVITDSKTVTHPITHPVPARLESAVPEDENAEISAENILVHHAHNGQINALAVSADGLTAFSGGQDGKVVLSRTLYPRDGGDARFMQSRAVLQGSKPILALALSPDEKRLAIAQFSSVAVYNIEENRITHMLSRVRGRIPAVAWDPQGELIAFGRLNGDVFIWNVRRGPFSGENTYDAAERYQGSNSPIISLIFHRSGRALFVTESTGAASVWRLLRTEEELGLRDTSAERDQEREGRMRRQFHTFVPGAEDSWLDYDSSLLYVAGSDGALYRLKIRGMTSLEKVPAEAGRLYSITGTHLKTSGQEEYLLATSGKEQRIKLWCTARSEGREGVNLLARSILLRDPPTLLRAGQTRPVLWAAEKTGNLLTLDANLLVKSPAWLARADSCRK